MPLALIGLDARLEVALIAFAGALVGYGVRHALERRLLRHRLELDHEFEQRKELQDLVGRYHGRLVEAADLFSFRMRQLYDGEVELPLIAPKGYRRLDYYFHSTVLRFLVLLSLAMRFEREAFFIDSQHSEGERDLTFLWLSKGLRWMAADASLFDDLDYVKAEARDHFFTDQLRDICAAIVQDDHSEVGLAGFVELVRAGIPRRPPALVRGGNELIPALNFFAGLRRGEDRLRWDRLVAFHLLAMGFLAEFGYGPQRPRDEDFDKVVGELEHPEVAANLRKMLGKLMVARSVPLLTASLEKRAPAHVAY